MLLVVVVIFYIVDMNKKNLWIIIFAVLVSFNSSCNRIYNNPYDPQTSSNSWMPSNMELIVDDSSSVRLIWEQEESRIDGFILTNNNNPNNGPITIGKDQITYSDNSSFILQNCGFNFNYTLKAYAGENQSDEIYYSNCVKTFVSTISVSNIGSESAFFQGNIYSSNSVDEKGFCWSTSTNPTINSNKVNLGSGAGDYNNQTNNLQQNTTYYLRAFASTSNEVYYGREIEFSTLEIVLPVVTTSDVTNISSSTAECGGNVTNDGNSNQTTKGVCWSSSSNPTVNDYNTDDGNATGTFSSSITNLSANSTYYVRAYAQNEAGTAYGDEKYFITLFGPPPTGPCNITSGNSSNTPYNLSIIPSTNIYNFGDDITVNMYHPSSSAGQSSILLYKDETQIMSLCSSCIFNNAGSGNYQRTVTLPSSTSVQASNCYTIRVLGSAGGVNAYLNVSNPFTIY